ncbi:5-methylthioadenosine/S-adenosylhomocysteine deaminase [Desulfovibrio sp. X2]|uniref:amidohydrolase family protein n=1 Tax=Desulfovibrio sp. X2 TaxID=941449 RepID=UPI000358ECC1|nr:amidohydrolase [Desulfovibrio sp. X2]EPR40774.1 5-methylthioadenosine/S-adenosylhomocysteine deaminase [Desulfovibrio sp. X2]
MSEPCDILLTADLLLAQDDARNVVEDAAVAVVGRRIAAVGPAERLDEAFSPARRLDLGRALLMPGLVNAHTHASMTMFRGLADDLPLMQWLQEAVFPVERRLTREAVRTGALIACAEMIRTGTTCFLDGYILTDEVLAAADEAGLRAVVGEGLFAFPTPAAASAEEAMERVRARQAALAGRRRLRQCVLPHSIYATTPEILRKAFDLARELGVPLALHLAESAGETAQVLAAHGARPVEFLRREGLLGPRPEGMDGGKADGPDLLLAHCVDLTPEEIALLAASGARVAHCPESNAKLASGFAHVAALRAAGVCVALGTDGAASNNDLNMFGEMNSAALQAKGRARDSQALSAQDVLDMATRGSAEAVGWPELGRLEAGGPADLVALDLSRPNLMPLHDPVAQVVYAATGHEVRLTMCAGRVLYEDGRFTTLDMDDLSRRARELAAWVRGNGAGAR